MKRIACMMVALGMSGALIAQGADARHVVKTTVVEDNDSLRIECVTVQDSRHTGDFSYLKDWFSFYNKTDRRLTVRYHVDATLTRYNRRYSYDQTLVLEPRASRGDNVMQHYPVDNYYISPRYHESDLRATLRLE